MSKNMGTINLKLTNHSKEVLNALENAKYRGLLSCGSNAEKYAKKVCPVDTGNLRNHITHGMNGANTVEIGTNVNYALYVECGTGSYCTLGNGTTKKSWVYKGDDGNWHMGYPQKARPYLKPAVADHASEYFNLLKDSFRNA